MCTAIWIRYTYIYINSFLGYFPIEVITEYSVEFPVVLSYTHTHIYSITYTWISQILIYPFIC